MLTNIYNYLVYPKHNNKIIKMLTIILIALSIVGNYLDKFTTSEVHAKENKEILLNQQTSKLNENKNESVNNDSKEFKIINNFIETNKNKNANPNDIEKLKFELINNNFKTSKYLVVSTIRKETGFLNIRSYRENDVFGFPQMKFSTITSLYKLFPNELPKINSGQEFLKNINAQVKYCDYYYYYLKEKNNSNLNNIDHVKFLAKQYNGGESGWCMSKADYYNQVSSDFFKLTNL